MFDHPMIDVVALVMSPERAKEMVIWLNTLSALMIGYLAFAVTWDAGIHCPLALLRAIHRVALVFLSIALAYYAAFELQNNLQPTGPALLVSVGIFVSTAISGLRHFLAPGIPRDTSWANAIAYTSARMMGREPARPFFDNTVTH